MVDLRNLPASKPEDTDTTPLLPVWLEKLALDNVQIRTTVDLNLSLEATALHYADETLHVGALRNTSLTIRITSYNVCYTKLLRLLDHLRYGEVGMLFHFGLDVLNDQNGVIDDNPDGENQPEECEKVDGKTVSDLHRGKGSHQRDGNGDGGNNRRTPRLQKDVDNDDDRNNFV